MKLLAVQGAMDEIDLAPLLAEVVFLVQFHEGVQSECCYSLERESEEENRKVEALILRSTVLHLAVYFDL